MEVSATNQKQLRKLLAEIYDSGTAETTSRELFNKLSAFAATPAGRAAAFDQRSSLLITYGDQVQETGRQPLSVLNDFCRKHLTGAMHGVHILPFYPFTSDDGFSVTDYFAVNPELGTWQEIQSLGESFDLMFDAVFNHMSAQGEWFKAFLNGNPGFRDFFVTVEGNPNLSQVVRPRALPLLTEFPSANGPVKVWTTFSADQVDLNFKNPRALLACIDALLFYVTNGARFIRLDAIAYLWKEIGTTCIHLSQTHRAIQLMRSVLDAVAPGVRLITETNVPHTDNVSYFGDGTNEAQLVYNFALPPLVLHTLATGNASRLTGWAKNLRLPTDQVAFFNFLASHDGIGVNPARGILSQPEIDALVERATRHGGFVSYKHNSDGSKSPYELNINYFDALSDPNAAVAPVTPIQRFLCAHAIQLSLAGMPGIYFHSLFGSRNDRAGAEASGIPRRINRQKLQRSELEAALADSESHRAKVFNGMKHLLVTRQGNEAFHPNAPQEILDLGPNVFALRRTSLDGNARVLAVHNVRDQHTTVELPVEKTSWKDLVRGLQLDVTARKLHVSLAPYEVAWLTPAQD